MLDPLYEHTPLPTQDLEPMDNYKSADLHEADIRVTYEEEIPLGMVLGPFSPQQAAEVCNCPVPELIHGALGAIDEGDEIRTIHDATESGTTKRRRRQLQQC